MSKDFTFNYLLPIILASLRFLLPRNYKLITGSVFKICCSSKFQQIIQGPNIHINHGFLIKTTLKKSYEQNKRRNVFSMPAHKFNFSIYSFDVLLSDTTYVKFLSWNINYSLHKPNFRDFSIKSTSKNLSAKKNMSINSYWVIKSCSNFKILGRCSFL